MPMKEAIRIEDADGVWAEDADGNRIEMPTSARQHVGHWCEMRVNRSGKPWVTGRCSGMRAEILREKAIQ